jgi:hypothetical protein
MKMSRGKSTMISHAWMARANCEAPTVFVDSFPFAMWGTNFSNHVLCLVRLQELCLVHNWRRISEFFTFFLGHDSEGGPTLPREALSKTLLHRLGENLGKGKGTDVISHLTSMNWLGHGRAGDW